ncbi:hypothetical protein RHGRI_038826 [Rhododendron griersonianum]|uniref:Uncharacterized protein n=1 Tax=Rhododendron griersonianum TaxID=479676 RepID=A0AAV6HNG6_9ERIC|nr:hypothetical protein RHGRI_038826 [Rhododendron griersonianum]
MAGGWVSGKGEKGRGRVFRARGRGERVSGQGEMGRRVGRGRGVGGGGLPVHPDFLKNFLKQAMGFLVVKVVVDNGLQYQSRKTHIDDPHCIFRAAALPPLACAAEAPPASDCGDRRYSIRRRGCRRRCERVIVERNIAILCCSVLLSLFRTSYDNLSGVYCADDRHNQRPVEPPLHSQEGAESPR